MKILESDTFRLLGGVSVFASRLVSSLAPPDCCVTAGQLGIVLSLALLAGCATRPAPPSSAQLEAIRARTETQFARAFYLKPAAINAATEKARLLAPLLIIEVPGTKSMPDWPGANESLQIFSHAGNLMLNGKPHEQMTYWWTYPKNASRSHERLPAQGVRITLSSAGRPVIWEVLADSSGAEIIFVSQSLEAQASREFGAPLNGRRFAVERPLSDAPDTVVARVIEDGPLAMGPIIYLRSKAHDVTTVICRCMDAQACELAGQREYDLMQAANPPRDLRKPAGIEQSLRLPKDF